MQQYISSQIFTPGTSKPSRPLTTSGERSAVGCFFMRVIIVGGSIAGCACAHALLKIGYEVVVLERATSVTAAGAVRELAWRQRP